MTNYKKITILGVVLFLVSIATLTIGEYDITFTESLAALFGSGTPSDVNIVQDVRLPRLVTGFFVGATLAISGIFIRTALNNPLADSGLLGIQSGATTFALVCILVFPALYPFLPLFAFMGGMTAFSITLMMSAGKSTNSLIITGVAINAFFSALIGIISTFNAQEIPNAMSFLNGSLANTTTGEMQIIMFYSVILLIAAFAFIPTLKLLMLNDNTLTTIGVNAKKMRLIVATFGVFLASISVAYVGIISFIGIIIPNITNKIIKDDIKAQMIFSIMLGGVVVVFCDLFQRVVFAPTEIPVGLVIGIVSAPLFIYILRRTNDHY